jgi:hypothetical protein
MQLEQVSPQHGQLSVHHGHRLGQQVQPQPSQKRHASVAEQMLSMGTRPEGPVEQHQPASTMSDIDGLHDTRLLNVGQPQVEYKAPF